MVIKGRIYEELGNFLIYIKNLIKSNNELMREIKEIDILGKNTQRKIHEIKNHLKLDYYSRRNQGVK